MFIKPFIWTVALSLQAVVIRLLKILLQRRDVFDQFSCCLLNYLFGNQAVSHDYAEIISTPQFIVTDEYCAKKF